MKNKLPKIGLLVLFFGISNAQVLTYVGSETKLYVKSGTLFYSGGDFQLNSNLQHFAKKLKPQSFQNQGIALFFLYFSQVRGLSRTLK